VKRLQNYTVKNKIESYSAGSSPSGKINAKAIAAMKELNYDLSMHHSKIAA
jgi:protein-tyrosine-phosphatase